MGDCRHIFFVDAKDKEAAFDVIAQTPEAVLIQPGVVKIIDASSPKANNFVTNMSDRLEVDIRAKTPFISHFFYEIFSAYCCTQKECEDPEDYPSESIASFFKAR